MKTVTVVSTWRSVQQFEVPDEVAGTELISWPGEYLDRVNALGAELVDWEVS